MGPIDLIRTPYDIIVGAIDGARQARSALRAQLSAISRQLSVRSGAKRAARAVVSYQPSAISLERRQARYARS